MTCEALLASRAKRHKELMKLMVTALTAPRILERDKTGKIIGSRVEMPK